MNIQQHAHGKHECYCPDCGYTEIVGADIRCNTLACPACGGRMRASQTGEYRPVRRIRANGEESHANLAWLLVPLVGVGVLALFLKLSQTKIE
jgi:hypothetical protein